MPSTEPMLMIEAGSFSVAAASSKGSMAWVREKTRLRFRFITFSKALSG